MAKKNGKLKGLWADFKKFISRGNVLDLAVGVIIGGAFNTIVTSLVNILLSLVTWGVPGGIKGLVTVLPALNPAQAGVTGIGQKFQTGQLNDMVVQFAKNSGVDITATSDTFLQWKNSLLGLYTLHGTTYTYNNSAVIDWGTFINAIISFLIIALTLFVVVKVAAAAAKKRDEFKKAALERYYEEHPEERPVPPAPGKPEPTEKELLSAILVELKKSNGEAPAPAEK